MRLAIIASHPVQYNAPLFSELARRPGLTLRVFYSWEGTAQSDDPEFGRRISWDIALLDGYDWEIVPNIAPDPGTHRFGGLDNPDMNGRVSAWGPDAILVFGWAWRTHLRALRHFKGLVPVLFRGDSTLISSSASPWKRALRRPALIWVYRHVDIALSPGRQNRAYFRAMGVPEGRIRWMPHAIDTERFTPHNDAAQAAAAAIRDAADVAPDEIAFVFAGKLVPRKEVGTLISAFRILSSEVPHVRLLIAGEGPDRDQLEAMAANLPGVVFLGFRNQAEMPSVYLAGDVFVLPSRVETWGLAVNEALALARPVIASDRVGAAGDLLAGKPYGGVVACGDAPALAAAMKDFVLARTDLAKLGAQARADSAEWSIPAAADAVTRALEEIAGDSKMQEPT